MLIGTKVLYHDEHGDCVAFVTDHEPGRADGDTMLVGFTNDAWEHAGGGDVFRRWSIEGTAQGEFTPQG